MSRFVDTNVFIYAMTGHPRFGAASRAILERIEAGEEAITSTLVLCEVAWVLESMGRQGDIKKALEMILSYDHLDVVPFDADDLLVGTNHMAVHHLDFNDGVNVSIMERKDIREVYSNDEKHLGKVDSIQLVFE